MNPLPGIRYPGIDVIGMKVVWLSANRLGYELLKEAVKLEGIEVSAIITLSDKASTVMYDGIGKDKWQQFISQGRGIKLCETADINRERYLIEYLSPDVIVMCGWRQIVSKEILDIPKLGVVSFHPTLLPKGRGPAPIINSIIEGIRKSGVTMFYAAEGVDNGDIIGQEPFEISDTDCAEDIYEKVIAAGKALIRKSLPLLAAGKAPRKPQEENDATYFKKRTLKDNEINLEKETPEEINRKIRALSRPYKGAYIKLGNKKLVIWKAKLVDEDVGQ